MASNKSRCHPELVEGRTTSARDDSLDRAFPAATDVALSSAKGDCFGSSFDAAQDEMTARRD
jgi:hypothetical protein